MDWTILGTIAGAVGLIYAFLRNFKNDIREELHKEINALSKRMDLQDERIFQLSTGKTLAEAMIEAKRKSL